MRGEERSKETTFEKRISKVILEKMSAWGDIQSFDGIRSSKMADDGAPFSSFSSTTLF